MISAKQLARRYTQWILYLMAISVLGWEFTPYKTFFLGYILGLIFSLYNVWSIYRHVNRFGQAVVQGQRMRSLGLLSRMAASGLSVLISLRYPMYFHVGAVMIGLFTPYIMILFHGIFQIRKRGENDAS